MINNYNRPLVGLLHGASLTALLSTLPALAEGAEPSKLNLNRSVDFIDASYSNALDKIVVAGRNGMLGWVTTHDEGASFQKIDGIPDIDFTAVASTRSAGTLVGTEAGELYRLNDNDFEKIARLSEFEEPVLDISSNGSHWAVGGRGMVARSVDGVAWEDSAPNVVIQPDMPLPANVAGEMTFGVANIDRDTFRLTAKSDGRDVREFEDYELYAEEGLLQLNTPLDASPTPFVAFEFSPGPAFRSGDVSWNVVLAHDSNVTIAGEFGLILQSKDDGGTWIRRNGRVALGERQARYWLAGDAHANRIVLTGAGGAIIESHNGGLSWNPVESPTKEGIFGAQASGVERLLIFGAVGLAGFQDASGWLLADRTDLQILSWLRTPVSLPDGRLIALGGRSTIVQFSQGGWSRLTLTQ